MNLLLNKMIRDKQPTEVVEAARKASAARQDLQILPRQADDPEFVKVFLNEAEKSLVKLEGLTSTDEWHENDDDMRAYIIHVHTVKTSLANIGKLDLSAVALKLEQAARNKIYEIVISETASFLITLRSFLEAYKKEEDSDGNAKDSVLKHEIAGLDIVKGLEQVGGNEAAYIQILRSYVSNVRTLLKTIETAEENKLTDYMKTVHAIKGTSYYIFAEQVGRRAENLEKAAGAGDFQYVVSHHPKFTETAWKLVGDIDELLLAHDNENPKQSKEKPDDEILSKILDASRRFDMDDLDDAMEEIEKYRYESDGGLVEWLRDAVDRMDLTQIVKKLSGSES